MGTETNSISILFCACIVARVKLNNPQMGTETYMLALDELLYIIHSVKLNNPQMGTETNYSRAHKPYQPIQLLN